MLFRTLEIKSTMVDPIYPIDSLFFYIKDNNFQKFKEVFEKHKLTTEVTDEDGNTLLNLAVQCNSHNIIQYLLQMGAKVNTQNVKIYRIIFNPF